MEEENSRGGNEFFDFSCSLSKKFAKICKLFSRKSNMGKSRKSLKSDFFFGGEGGGIFANHSRIFFPFVRGGGGRGTRVGSTRENCLFFLSRSIFFLLSRGKCKTSFFGCTGFWLFFYLMADVCDCVCVCVGGKV